MAVSLESLRKGTRQLNYNPSNPSSIRTLDVGNKFPQDQASAAVY